MALQGTIDAFPLTDVLALLASSARTGRLSLTGDRGSSELWIDEGSVTGGGAAADGSTAALLVFDMLRYSEGSFVFDTDLGETGRTHPVDAEPLVSCVDAAAELLEEWVRIESVVPSMYHHVELVAELAEESVTLDRATWSLIAAAGDGPTIWTLAARLGMDEFTCCSGVADVVARSLVLIGDPTAEDRSGGPAASDEDDLVESPHEADPFAEAESDDPLRGDVSPEEDRFPERFPIDDLVGPDAADTDDPWSSPEMERLESQRFAAAQTFEAVGLEPLPLGELPDDPAPQESEPITHWRNEDPTADVWDEMVAAQSDESGETADEVLRQMSRLSPQAAEAIAAALKTPGEQAGAGERTERDPGPDGDGPISYSGSF